MFKGLFVYVKYPSVAGIIATIWFFSGLLIIKDQHLPIFMMVLTNMVVSLLIGLVGFRVDKS